MCDIILSRIKIWDEVGVAHFEDAVEDEDEFWETGRNMSVTLCTFAMDFLTFFLTESLVEALV
jgi:hypothetical protein